MNMEIKMKLNNIFAIIFIMNFVLVINAKHAACVKTMRISEYNSDFSYALEHIDKDEYTLLVIDKPCFVRKDVVVPSMVEVAVEEYGLVHHESNSMVFHGPLSAGERQVFSGAGVVELLRNEVILLEWFGVAPSRGAAFNSSRFERGFQSISSRGGGKVVLGTPGVYHLNEELSLAVSGVDLVFGTGVVLKTEARNGLRISGQDTAHRVSDIRVANLVLDGCGKTQHGILAIYCDRVVLEHCRIINSGADGIYIGGIGVNTSSDCKISHCTVENSGAFGIIAVGTHNLEVSGCTVNECKESRRCASAIQVKNSTNFLLSGNSTNGGEHGINIRCSAKGSDTSGICKDNVCRNPLKVGIYCHHETDGGSTGELRDLIIINNNIYNVGWFFISVSAEKGHWASDVKIKNNRGKNAGTNGMSLKNVKRVIWKDNEMIGINVRGMVLNNVYKSSFTGGLIERDGMVMEPVIKVVDSNENVFEQITLIQPDSNYPCIMEDRGSDRNLYLKSDASICGHGE